MDRTLTDFLDEQYHQGLALARDSELLDLIPLDGAASRCYVAELRCRGLVRRGTGTVRVVDRFRIGIRFPDDYLKGLADAFRVVNLLDPPGTFHPNVRFPLICIGRLRSGTGLVDILYQTFELLTYHRYNPVERDALNHDACAWARRNAHRFPIDDRPLKHSPERLPSEAPS